MANGKLASLGGRFLLSGNGSFKEKTTKGQFIAYINACFRWIEKKNVLASFMVLFYHHCTIDTKFKNMNTEFVNLGEKRISTFLNQKKLSSSQASQKSKLIQITITGALLTLITENHSNSKKVSMQKRNRYHSTGSS